MDLKKIRIAVLGGGMSPEREISLISGQSVYGALKRAGCDAVWVDVRDENFAGELREKGAEFAFLALHGVFGEDGGAQEVLEREGIPYSGSGPRASRRAMDKSESRVAFERAGLNVPRGIVVDHPLDPRISLLGPPLFAKPVLGGSSIGVTLVREPSGVRKAVETALLQDTRVVLEERIVGREMTVGILGSDTLPPIEIKTNRDFFDYEAKYGNSGTRYEEPADLDQGALRELEDVAFGAHRALGCEVFSRVDLMVSPARIYVLEVNAIPGLTPKSLLPKMASKRGISFENLCLKIIEESLRIRGHVPNYGN